MACDRPRSYLIASSPKSQYEDLNSSLASQVVDAKKNLLGVFKNLGGIRDTITSTPATSTERSNSSQIFAQRSQMPLPEIEDGDEVETSMLDTTAVGDNQQIQKYQALIEELRSQLLEEKRKFLRVEQEIREEVCKEFASHMADMEKRLTEARREGIEDAEDLADERLELYIETATKRQRERPTMCTTTDGSTSFYTACNEDHSRTPGPSLGNEKKLLEEKEKEIAELKAEKEKAIVEFEMKKEKEIIELKTEKEKEIVDLRTELEVLKKKTNVDGNFNTEELIQALEAKNKECRDLDEMLCEAGETFKNNADEIRRLESYVSVMEQTVKKRDEDIAKFRQLDSELQKKNEIVRRLEARILELEEKVIKDSRFTNDLASAQMEQDLADARRILDQTQKEVETLKNKLQNTEIENQRLKESPTPVGQMKTDGNVGGAAGPTPDTPTSATDESMDGGFKCIELESKIFELEKSLDIFNRENETLKLNVQRSEELLQKCRCVELENKLQELDKSSETFKKENENLKNSLNSAEEKMQKCQCNLFQNKINELEKSLDSISRENETLKHSVKLADEQKQKHETLESNFDSLKKSLESMTYSLFEKNTQISKLEEEKKLNEEKVLSLTADLEKQEKSHLEISNQLRFDLDATKVLLVEAKKSKLEAYESLQSVEEECRRTKNALTSLESDLEIEKQNNRRIIEDSVNNEKLIDSYKNAMREQEEIQQNMENALKSRREEVEQLNQEVVELKNKLEKSENNCLLQQKEINRMKNDLELRKDVEDKLKNEIKDVENKALRLNDDLKTEKQKFSEKELEFAKNSASEISAKVKRIEELTLENASLSVKIESLTKDLKTKNGFVNLLNGKIAEKEQTLNNLESEVNKIEKTHQEVLAGKERQLEAWKQQKEASIIENEKLKKFIKETEAENEQLKQKLSEKDVELNEKEAEFTRIKSEYEKVKLPPVVPTTAKRRKQASTSVEDDANEIEVTPWISKKIAQQPRARVGNKAETPEPQESSSTRRKTSTADIKKSLNCESDTSPSHSSVVSDASNHDSKAADVPSVKNIKKPRTQSKPKQKKSVAILTEENSPVFAGSISVVSTPLNEVLPIIIPPESAGRPSRRAKSTARNGIFAVTEYLRNSPNAGSTTSNEQEDNGDEKLPPKKRKRVYKSPSKVNLPSPSEAVDAFPESSSAPTAKERISIAKKTKKKV